MEFKFKNPEAMTAHLVKLLQDAADETFARSQRYVHVITGTLKKSGVVEYKDNGAEIVYRVSYAAEEELGLAPGTVKQVPKYTVPKHTRRRKGKLSVVQAYDVKAHTQTFKRGREAHSYLGRAYEEIKPRLKDALARVLKIGIETRAK